MKILGISTAGKIVSAGLIEDKKVLAEFTSRALKSEDLMVLVQRITEEAGVDIKNIDGIAVAEGPGSYSGLRGGLAAAKSLAQVLNIPITGVSTLEAVAYDLVKVRGTVAAICDAVRGEVNFALFTSDSKKLRRISDDMVVTEKRLGELLKQIKGEIHIASAEDALPKGVNVAFLGMDRINAGQADDVLKMTPKYSHTPNVREFGNRVIG